MVSENTARLNDNLIQRETILLLGNFRPSLAVARQLGRDGHTLIVGRCSPTAVEKSRYVKATWQHSDMYGNISRFLKELKRYLEENPDISLILPVSERSLTTLAANRHKIATPIACVDPKLVDTCLNKGKMAQFAAELGIPQAPFALASTWDELLKAGEEVGFPCVARPNDGEKHSVKAYFFASRAQLVRVLPHWPSQYTSLLIQSLVAGERYNRYFIAENGVILQYTDVITVRTDRINGSGYGVEGVTTRPLPELTAPSDRLIRELDYTGIGCVQYLVDHSHHQISFLEINPRLGGNYAFTLHCGFDQVGPLLAMARNRPLEQWRKPFKCARNKRFTWLYGDLIGLISSLDNREVGLLGAANWSTRMCRSALRADMHLNLDWRDIKPSSYYLLSVGEAISALVWRLLVRTKRKLSEFFTI